jgi:hypothetical protein
MAVHTKFVGPVRTEQKHNREEERQAQVIDPETDRAMRSTATARGARPAVKILQQQPMTNSSLHLEVDFQKPPRLRVRSSGGLVSLLQR